MNNKLRPICFMVMPFGTKQVLPRPDAAPEQIDFDALWDRALSPLIDELGYEPVRADQDTGASIIMEMLERLYFSDLVVADMTLPNGNVYYEVGIRHACKPAGCLLLSADWAQVLFDADQMPRLVYPLTDGSIGEAAAGAIKNALRAEAVALAAGRSPMYQHIPGFPDPEQIDPNRASVIRAQLNKVSEFQARVRAVRLARGIDARVEAARALRDDYPASDTIPQSVAIEVAMLLRDCSDWQDCIDYIDALPESLRGLSQLQEQRCLALSKTGNHLEAIGALEQLIDRSGDSSERQGLIGGRYKKLADEARNVNDTSAYHHYIDLAIVHYERGMHLDLNDYYPSSNLPRLYRERDEEGDGQLAEMVAQVAMMACERARARNSQDEWLNPTLLGLAFDAADLKRARQCVKAVRREGHAAWKVETTLADLQRSISQNPDPQAQQSLVAMLEELKALLGSQNNP